MSEENRYITCAGCGRRVDPARTPVYRDFDTGLDICESCRREGVKPGVKPRKPWASALRIIFANGMYLSRSSASVRLASVSSTRMSLISLLLLVWANA